jgi:hypothetical protein
MVAIYIKQLIEFRGKISFHIKERTIYSTEIQKGDSLIRQWFEKFQERLIIKNKTI